MQQTKESLFQAIKSSKKYKQINEEVILKEINNYTNKNPKWQDFKEKFIIKDIKAKLHKISASFQIKPSINKKRYEFLENKDYSSLLKTNRSTKERLASYNEVYDKIFKITGKPQSILDLGCGLNPISFNFMNLKNIEYFAYDINEGEIEIINNFFITNNLQGEAKAIDLSNLENISNLPSADLCFMFKFIDTIEQQGRQGGHKLAEEIIKIISTKCKFIVVSFSTITLGNRKMNHPYRGWIERMLERINLQFETFEIENEVFYIIGK